MTCIHCNSPITSPTGLCPNCQPVANTTAPVTAGTEGATYGTDVAVTPVAPAVHTTVAIAPPSAAAAPVRQQVHVVMVGSKKSVGAAAILGFFFGPLGLLYASVPAAVLMFCVNLVVGFFTLGFGLFLTWPVCALVGGIAAGNHNSRVAALTATI